MEYYAHSIEGFPTEKWQPLECHLVNVAKLTAHFALCFGAEKWGEVTGLNHDIGKGVNQWQAYLRKVNDIEDEFAVYYEGHPPHASVGAQWLFQHSNQAGKLMAYCISGHHGGLPDWAGSQAALGRKLQQPIPEVSESLIPPDCPTNLPFQVDQSRMGYQFQFFTRMLFSCLVDADYLDTEKFLDKGRSNFRDSDKNIAELQAKFWQRFNVLRDKVDKTSHVNIQRELVLENCLQSATKEPGLFSLTVPTGGGKTLASLAFALNHAVLHGKRRIIYVIPFTSIIEQNANVFKGMLGDDAVLEHHCNFIIDDSDLKSRLAIENWDVPVVVTTNVQFFDSFYANKTSKCRKLHNIADSIIIFDEVQAIPVEKLTPCLEVIKELSTGYGVTSVLCTATQPAIKVSDHFSTGLESVREIITDIPELFAALKRTEEVFIGTYSELEVAESLRDQKQVLCIVNTRQQALDIFNALPESEGNFHLSALMHPVHRTIVLDEVRRRLNSEDTHECRVISTQLIEAGVDVDFPCVYRAVAGIDSIAQAAGRCNRNGKSRIPCRVNVFEFPEGNECSYFRHAAQSAAKLFESYSGKLTAPECVQEYFDDFYWKNEQRMDEQKTLEKCASAGTLDIQFREIAEFQMIKTATEPIIVAIDEEAIELVNLLEIVEHPGGVLRKLQKYSVQVYPYQLDEIKSWLENPMPEVWVLRSAELYSEVTGLLCKQPEGSAFFG